MSRTRIAVAIVLAALVGFGIAAASVYLGWTMSVPRLLVLTASAGVLTVTAVETLAGWMRR